MEQQNSYREFKDLNCWKEGRELRKKVAEITKKFPASEQYLLRSQLIRAARSITANIAEDMGDLLIRIQGISSYKQEGQWQKYSTI